MAILPIAAMVMALATLGDFFAVLYDNEKACYASISVLIVSAVTLLVGINYYYY